jgi:hypothetical protein
VEVIGKTALVVEGLKVPLHPLEPTQAVAFVECQNIVDPYPTYIVVCESRSESSGAPVLLVPGFAVSPSSTVAVSEPTYPVPSVRWRGVRIMSAYAFWK